MLIASIGDLLLDLSVDTPDETARVLQATWETETAGVLVDVPPLADLYGAEDVVVAAMAELGQVEARAVTPHLLAKVAALSGGKSLDFNVRLVIHNAQVAAACAVTYSSVLRPTIAH